MVFYHALILLSSLALALGAYPFKAETCQHVFGASRDVELISMSLKQDPIEVPGTVEAAIKFKVKKAPVTGKRYDLEVTIHKSSFLGEIKIPCVNGLGSCTFDFCDFLATKSKQLAVDGKCKDLPCSCDEVKVGEYDIPSFKVEFTEEDLKSASIDGDYKVDMKIRSHVTKEVLACVHSEFTIKDTQCTGIFCP